MRTHSIIVPVLTLAASTLLVGCASTQSASTQGQATTQTAKGSNTDPRADLSPIVDTGATMRVNGMSCPKCANNIERQLAQIEGVDDIQIDLGSGVVSVGFTPDHAHPSPAQLADAIDRTGFTLVSVHAGRTP